MKVKEYKVHNLRMNLYDTRNELVCPDIAADKYEKFESEIFHSYIRPSDRVVDVGAHIGYYSILMASLIGPFGRLVALEPIPVHNELLRANLELNGFDNWEVLKKAASDKDGSSYIYEDLFNSGDNRMWQPPGLTSKRTIECVRVDDVVGKLPINFIKIDTQGHECYVLRGMPRLLAQKRLTIAIEFWPYGLMGAGSSPDELLNMLCDFKIYMIDETNKSLVKVDDPRSRVPINTQNFLNLICVK